MKMVYLSTSGVTPALPGVAVHPARGRYLRFDHGEEGRGRKLVFFPLGARDFPAPAEGERVSEALREQEYELLPVSEGRAHILVRGRQDGQYLVLWNLSPGFRGGASYSVSGRAKVIAEGYEAQGIAGRAGGAPCPVVSVEGPCVLRWSRSGRLYGSEADWQAVYEDGLWSVMPDTPESCALDIALASAE